MHCAWAIETAFLGLKVTLKGSDRVLRSQTLDGVRQELFGMLVVYQAARQIVGRLGQNNDIDPDRISLTVTLRTARLTVVNASGTTISGPDSPSMPRITEAVLDPRDLAPQHRRLRILPRRVKRPISTFAYNATRKDHPMHQVTIKIAIELPANLPRRPA